MNERSKLRSFFLGDIDDYGIILIVLFILTLASSALMRSYLDFAIAPITVTAYFVCYLLRYRNKPTKHWWDQFKLALTLFVLFSHLEKNLVGQLGDEPFFTINLAWPFTYYIDRIILRAPRKLTWIVTSVFMLTTLFFVVYAQIQVEHHARELDRTEALAKHAAKLQKTAEQEAANALEALDRVKALEIELKNCQQSK